MLSVLSYVGFVIILLLAGGCNALPRQLLTAMLLGGLCGAWAHLWVYELTLAGHLGAVVPRLFWRVAGAWRPWKEAISKPLFDCSLCHAFWVAGIMAFAAADGIIMGLSLVVAALFSAYVMKKKYDTG